MEAAKVGPRVVQAAGAPTEPRQTPRADVEVGPGRVRERARCRGRRRERRCLADGRRARMAAGGVRVGRGGRRLGT